MISPLIKEDNMKKTLENHIEKILVVDDEERIRELISKYLVFEGFQVMEAKNGVEAINTSLNNKIDLIIMDIMMEELDGFSAVKKIRETEDIPIIMLSAKGEEYDKIYGFELGIDDYVTKPFSPKELVMRVKAILERTKNKNNKRMDIWEYEDLLVNFSAYTVEVKNKRIDLTPKEYELLFYMIKNINIALSREQIMENVWGYEYYGTDRTLDTHIKSLRKALGEYARLIVTVRGVGYRFEVER